MGVNRVQSLAGDGVGHRERIPRPAEGWVEWLLTPTGVSPIWRTRIRTHFERMDPDLAATVATSPGLPAAVRAGILAMVKAAG